MKRTCPKLWQLRTGRGCKEVDGKNREQGSGSGQHWKREPHKTVPNHKTLEDAASKDSLWGGGKLGQKARSPSILRDLQQPFPPRLLKIKSGERQYSSQGKLSPKLTANRVEPCAVNFLTTIWEEFTTMILEKTRCRRIISMTTQS